MKKIILEIPIPEFEEIERPTTWACEFGVFDDINDIYAIKSTISYFKTSRDAPYLINAYQDLRQLVVKGLLERHAHRDSKLSSNHMLVEAISHRIFSFRDGTGRDINDYNFDWKERCTGKKIGVIGTTYEYDNIDELVSTTVSSYTNRFNGRLMYDYKLVDVEM